MFEVLVIAACLLVNALLAAVEMAFVTVGKPQLRLAARQGNKDAQKILLLREKPERTLSVIQVGITLVGAIAAAVGGAGALESISPILETRFGWSEVLAEFIAIVLVVIPIAYLSVLVGELVPKTLALRHPMQIMLKASRSLAWVDRVFSPVVTALEWSTQKVVRIMTRHPKNAPITSENETVELSDLSHQTREYVLNLVSLEHRKVRDVSVPWDQVIYVRHDATPSEIESVIIHSGHTRLPVVLGKSVIGILNTKEFIALRFVGDDGWSPLIRPAIRVQESDSLWRAFRAMQEIRSHLSVVYSGDRPTGIVTMEDILEEIIGDVFDEDDDQRVRKIMSRGRAARTLTPKKGA